MLQTETHFGDVRRLIGLGAWLAAGSLMIQVPSERSFARDSARNYVQTGS